MGTFRTDRTEAKYDAFKASGMLLHSCPLCNEKNTIKEFAHWRIVENAFPYDAVARVHHMLVSKRHVSTEQLTDEERLDFEEAKKGYVYDHYEFMIEPVPKQRSIPEHSHLHILIAKDLHNV
jgi:hypothetical protein